MDAVVLKLAYDGTAYHGFAIQPSARTIAGELLGAVQQMDPSVRRLRGVSRTDAGVHARGQLVAFDPSRMISPRGWVLGLAAHLPSDIAPRSAALVPLGFDPRAHVREKWYRYTILNDNRRDPFLDGYAWRLGRPLDLSAAELEAQHAVGTHDFKAFRSAADERTTTVRTISSIKVARAIHDERIVYVDVRGNAFLHNMVRILVGAIVDVAMGRLGCGAVARAIESGRRKDLGVTAPAHGLCLQWVDLLCGLDPEKSWPESGLIDVARASVA